jgi:glutaredoxin 2
MVNKIIKHFNKEIGNKMERNKSRNKVESLFDKIEELRNIESRLINERIIRIERINFEIEETRKERAKAEEDLKLKLNELSYNFEPGIKSNAKDLSFEMKGVEKIK